MLKKLCPAGNFGSSLELAPNSSSVSAGAKSTLPSLRYRARFQGKVSRYPEAEDGD